MLSALKFSVEDIGIKFCVTGMAGVAHVESNFDINAVFGFGLIAELRLCSFNTVCCICLICLSSALEKSFDFLVSALGLAPSLSG